MKKKLNLLIVDDDHYMTLTMADILSAVGYRVTTANNAFEALQVLPKGFDCVLSDIIMPGMNGVDLQKNALKQYGKIPFLFMTAYAEKDMYEKACEQGAVAFLEKPIRMIVLFAVLERLEREKDTLISAPDRL